MNLAITEILFVGITLGRAGALDFIDSKTGK
jgi:hypothetical protein